MLGAGSMPGAETARARGAVPDERGRVRRSFGADARNALDAPLLEREHVEDPRFGAFET
jgi:hypothetical protein